VCVGGVLAEKQATCFKTLPNSPGSDITNHSESEEVNIELFFPQFHAARLPLLNLSRRQEVYFLKKIKFRNLGLVEPRHNLDRSIILNNMKIKCKFACCT
jgi:hypothetical protein